MPFSIIRNDITKIKADAIVNTANPRVAVGTGVDAAIYEAAGREKLLAAREKIGELRPGEAGITPAFDIDAKFIIHVSGPWWEGGAKGEEETLRRCYDRALMLAHENGCGSIAFPLLATGNYGFPKELGISIAVGAFTEFLMEHEMEIILAVFGQEAADISGRLIADVKSFVDEDYEEEAFSKEYAERKDVFFGAAQPPAGPPENEAPRRRPSFFPGRKASRKEEARAESPAVRPETTVLHADMDMAPMQAAESAPSDGYGMNLEKALKGIYKESFGEHLQQLINKKGLKNSEVYAAANISKQYFSKLLKNQVNPSKEKVLALAVGLRLNMDEAVDFLRLAGYAFSPISQTDKVVEYFIRRRDFSVMKIDIVLYDYGLDPISSPPG